MVSEENTNQNNESPKGHLIMIIVAIIVIVLFCKFVLPTMEKGTKPPSSIITGEVYNSDEKRTSYSITM